MQLIITDEAGSSVEINEDVLVLCGMFMREPSQRERSLVFVIMDEGRAPVSDPMDYIWRVISVEDYRSEPCPLLPTEGHEHFTNILDKLTPGACAVLALQFEREKGQESPLVRYGMVLIEAMFLVVPLPT